MLAAFHVAPNRLELRETRVPELEPGEALIRVRACGFCGSDRHDLSREPWEVRIPGHEFSGVVEALAGESDLSVGDAVVVDPILRCGRCEYCRTSRDHLCRSMAVIGCQTAGGLAEFVKAPISNLREVPEGFGFEVATLADPLAVALHASELAGMVERRRCLILGAGTIGLLMAQVLGLCGAGEVYIADIERSHLDLAAKLDGVRTVNLATSSAEALPSDCDIAFELAGGDAPTLGYALASVGKGGRVVCVAQRPPTEIDYPRMLFGEIRLQGVFGQTARNFIEAVRALASGKVDAAPLITDRFPLAQVQEALDRFMKPESVKVVVTCG